MGMVAARNVARAVTVQTVVAAMQAIVAAIVPVTAMADPVGTSRAGCGSSAPCGSAS
jgi:hypothetical protein